MHVPVCHVENVGLFEVAKSYDTGGFGRFGFEGKDFLALHHVDSSPNPDFS